ncbi:MAG: AsmA-like C-terminal region-containing protein [Sediminibacterium sp.]
MKKWLSWLMGITGGVMLVFLLLFVGLSYYINSQKKELIEQATTAIHEKLGGDVSIEDLNVTFFRHFPGFSIRLINVRVSDSLYKNHGRSLLSAENLFVRLSTPHLIFGKLHVNKLTVKRGGFDLFTDASGYTNGYLLQQNDSTSSKKKEQEENISTRQILDWIVVEDFTFHLQDIPGDKQYGITINKLNARVQQSGKTFSIEVKKELSIGGLAFKKKNGSFVTNQKMKGEYVLLFDIESKKLSFKDMAITIGTQPFNFAGDFWLGTENKFDLRIKSRGLLVNFARSLLTPKISKAVGLADVKKPLDVDAHITGDLGGGDPRVHVLFTTNRSDLSTKWLDMKNASFSGEYLNEVVPGAGYTDENSHIYIKKLDGFWEGLPLNVRELKITNLITPALSVKIKTSFPLQELNSALQSKTIQFTGGEGQAELSYNGRTDSISSKNSRLSGYLHFSNGEMLLTGPRSKLKQCRGNFRFDNANLIVDSLNAILAGNPVYMNGQANNVLSLLSDDHVPVSLDWNIFAPVINLNSIQSVLKRKVSVASSAKTKKTKMGSTVENIDHLLSSGKVTVSLRADRLQFQKMDASNFEADIALEGNTWAVKKASLQHGNGSVAVTANIQELSPNRLQFKSSLDLRNVDASKTFYAFESFGIKDLRHQNIRGRLNASARYSLLLNGSGEPDWLSISGKAFFSIKNGALINYPPLMSIQKTAFKKRDFSNVRFAEIRNNLKLENAGIQIERMAINSSVLTLFLQGVYGLKNNTDISIQVPLKNLSKKQDEAHPAFVSGDSKGGMSVFLRARSDKTGKISIHYDPLARFRKK